MRVVRVIQLLVVLALIGYLFVLNSVNPQTIILPFLVSLPTAWVVAASLLLGFVVGWLSLAGRVFRLSRDNRSLRQRLIKAGNVLQPQVIPDRTDTAAPRTVRFGGPGAETDAAIAAVEADAAAANSGDPTTRTVRVLRGRGKRPSSDGR